MDKELKILMLEDVPTDAELAARELRRAGIRFVSKRVETEQEFRGALREFVPEVILSDFTLPSFDGLSALQIAQEVCPEVPFIFVSGTIGEERAIEALKRGATDYVLKNNLARLVPSVKRALSEAEEKYERRRAEKGLREQQQFLRRVIDTDLNLIFVKDWAGKFTLVNKAVADIYGTTIDNLVGKTDADFNPNKEEVENFLHDDKEVMRTLRPKFIAEEPVTEAKTGEVRWFQTIKVPLISPNGKAHQVLGVATDITERKNQEAKIARLSRIHAVLSNINSAIVRIRDSQELFKEACRIAVEHGKFKMAWVGLAFPGIRKAKPVAWMGFEEGYLDEVGLQLRDVTEDNGMGGRALQNKKILVANDVQTDPKVVFKNEALKRGYRSLAALPLLVGGEAVGVFVLYAGEANYFDDEEVKLLSELAADISFALDHIEKEEKLDYLAYYDALTGLPNRTLFRDRLHQHIKVAQQDGRMLAVMVTDLERFANINNTFGRQAGDLLLKQIAERLKGSFADPEALARTGEDNFAVFIRGPKEAAEVAHIAEVEVMGSFSLPFSLNGDELGIPVKAGIALFPADGTDADTLLANAEAALKKAKTSAQTYLFYAPEMNARVAEKLKLENKLRRALEEQQFILYYQPKIELASGRITGLEALIRWNDPDTGLVPPFKFIPILEETGMILDVGSWVIEKALSDYRQMLAKGLAAPRIAVNVSQIQLRHKGFVSQVRQALEKGADGKPGLDLEITESLIMEDIEANIEKLRTVREMGLGIAIDDFGTGYSSLSYIAKLPVDTLKIDRSFIIDLGGSSESMTIVSTMISLAHSLNLKVVAEGVETEEQSKLLRLLRCDQMQGYLYSPPVPLERIEVMLMEKTASGATP